MHAREVTDAHASGRKCWHDAAMDMHAEIAYPTASPDEAFVLTTSPEFRADVCRATHALDYDVDIEAHEDGGATVTVNRVMPADVPDFVKKFVGDTVTVIQTETWGRPDDQGRRTGDLVVQIKGQPAQMNGTLALDVVGSGVRQRIDGELRVSVPFVGKKIEPEIAKAILAGVEKEQEVGIRWLAASP